MKLNCTLLMFLVTSWFVMGEPVSPPANMQEHRRWARSAPTIEERIKRLEGFWDAYLPQEEGGRNPELQGYGDGSHGLAVAGCAWDLARAYTEAGDQKKALKMLDWLQKFDSKSMLVSPAPKAAAGEGSRSTPAPHSP